MTNFLLIQHGETRTRPITFGGLTIERREIYCAACGWIDLFLVGERAGFDAKHGECNQPPQTTGAEIRAARMTA